MSLQRGSKKQKWKVGNFNTKTAFNNFFILYSFFLLSQRHSFIIEIYAYFIFQNCP